MKKMPTKKSQHIDDLKYKYEFSVVMPVYNVEKYLDQSIESIINQTVGFEDNIQLILVNDGSTDNSGRICEKYQNRYPANIIYIDKEHKGVSNTRNTGLKYAEGRYINFLDSDDMWDSAAFECTRSFFENNPTISIATGRIIVLKGEKRSGHYLDYKYKKTRVVDINKNINMPEMSCSKTFFAAQILEDHLFDERVSISEDFLLINTLLLQEKSYGVIREAEYIYRKRDDATSTIDNNTRTKGWYTITPKLVYKQLLELSRQKNGRVLPYIQYLLMADMQWRITLDISEVLNEGEKEAYIQDLKDILQNIEDSIILKQKKMTLPKKAYAFRLKYGNDKYNELEKTKEAFSKIISMNAIIVNANKELIIEGRALEKLAGDDYYIYAKDRNNHIYDAEYKEYPIFDTYGVDPAVMIKGYEHTFRLPLENRCRYSFYITDGKGIERRLKLTFGKFSRLIAYDDSFFATDKHIIKLIDNKICVYDYKSKTFVASMRRYHKGLREKTSSQVITVRNKIILKKMFSRKPIWIISDRSHLARDNGAALFDYLMKSDIKKRFDIYFLLEKESEDYERIKRIGNVVEFGSERHKVLQGAASLVISSSGDEWVFNPYGEDYKYYRDLLNYNFVFLQHGVTIHDLSGWLHKYKKNIKLFSTTTVSERNSIIDGNYGYNDRIVKITGMTRYDKLRNGNSKTILFAPTWRKKLAGESLGNSKLPYKEGFKDSDYRKFYDTLINDERILRAMEKAGYIGYFCVHPTMELMSRDFNSNRRVKVIRGGADYSTLISESSLLITDYSSTSFDFAYLYKPIIYTQFDKDCFYESQLYSRGYYDYEQDGFGPVCYNYETAVEAIVNAINNGCVEQNIYAERVKRTFAYYRDKNNCSRVTEELIKLSCEEKK